MLNATDKTIIISIHALRVEGDIYIDPAEIFHIGISIHALRVEGDPVTGSHSRVRFVFLSTPSGWRATSRWRRMKASLSFLSTPSGWRATLCAARMKECREISIHALRVEGDFSLTIS